MGAEEGGGVGEGAAGAEVGRVAEGEPLQLLVLLQREVLEPGLELCALLRIKKNYKIMLKKQIIIDHWKWNSWEDLSKVQLLGGG